MALDKAIVAHIARLARIKVAEPELDRLAGELGQILQWIERLDNVDTEGVAPMTSVVAAELPRRADIVTDGNRADDILANAPDANAGFFGVPKVIE